MALPKAAFVDQLDDLEDLLPSMPKKSKRPPAAAQEETPAPGSSAPYEEKPADEGDNTPNENPEQVSSERVFSEEKAPAPARKPARSKLASETPGALVADISATNLQGLRELTVREKSKNLITARTHGQVVLDAIEAHQEELQKFWKTPAPAVGAGNGLFKRQPVVRKRRRHAEPTGQITLAGIADDDAQQLEKLWEEWGAPSRSAFVDQALSLYLPTTKRRARRASAGGVDDDSAED